MAIAAVAAAAMTTLMHALVLTEASREMVINPGLVMATAAVVGMATATAMETLGWGPTGADRRSSNPLAVPPKLLI